MNGKREMGQKEVDPRNCFLFFKTREVISGCLQRARIGARGRMPLSGVRVGCVLRRTTVAVAVARSSRWQ